MRPQRTLIGALTTIVGLLGGCAYAPPDDPYMSAPPMWGPSPSTQVIRVYEEPPLDQPATVFIDVAPPPMLVEVRPVRPSFDAVWIGGYWGWQSRWVWVRGRWAPPPRPGYVWTHPYYENRGGGVVFVPGFWRGPGAVFAPPPHHPRMPPGPPVQGGRRATRGPEWSRPAAPLPVVPQAVVPAPTISEGSSPARPNLGGPGRRGDSADEQPAARRRSPLFSPPRAHANVEQPTAPNADATVSPTRRFPSARSESHDTDAMVFRPRPVPGPQPSLRADQPRQQRGSMGNMQGREQPADRRDETSERRPPRWGSKNKEGE